MYFVIKMNWRLCCKDAVKVISFILSFGFVVASNVFVVGFEIKTTNTQPHIFEALFIAGPFTLTLMANFGILCFVIENIICSYNRFTNDTFTTFQLYILLIKYGMVLCMCQIIGTILLSIIKHKLYHFDLVSYSTGLYFILSVLCIIGLIKLTIYCIQLLIIRYRTATEENTAINTEMEIIIDE